jgi:hypothetical protein
MADNQGETQTKIADNQIFRGNPEDTFFARDEGGQLTKDDKGMFNGDGVQVKDEDGNPMPFSRQPDGRFAPDPRGTVDHLGNDLPKKEEKPATTAPTFNDTYSRKEDGSLKLDPKGTLDKDGNPIDFAARANLSEQPSSPQAASQSTGVSPTQPNPGQAPAPTPSPAQPGPQTETDEPAAPAQDQPRPGSGGV